MTDKLTLTTLSSLQNDTSATDKINANSAAIITAIDNTLSRDGTSPNQMSADLDMNSHRVLNLPAPANMFEPLRVLDAATLNGSGTISPQSLPAGGTSGQILTKNSATNYDASWSSNTLSIGGSPVTGLGATLQVNAGILQTTGITGDISSAANSFNTTIANNAVSNAKFRQSGGLSLIGNSTNGAANVSDIAGTSNQIPIVNSSGSSLGFTTVSGDLTNTSGVFTVSPLAITGSKIASNTVANANIAQASAVTLKGNPTNSLSNVQDFTIQGLTNLSSPDANNDKLLILDHTAGTFKYSTPGQIASSATAGVSALNSLTGSLTVAAGTGATVSAASTTVTVGVGLSTASNALSGDVSCSSAGVYFDGPSMAQGTSGTWFVSGHVTILDTATAHSRFNIKLWDGTTIIASATIDTNDQANSRFVVPLSGLITSPAANIRISVSNTATTTGVIKFNLTGSSKDSIIFGIRTA